MSSCPFLPMRRAERAMSVQEAWDLLGSPGVSYGFLGLHGVEEEGGFPYVVPMSFAADREAHALYFHATADAASKRHRAALQDERVCFTVVDPASAFVPNAEGRACRSSMRYASVVVLGRMTPVESPTEKVRCLNFLVEQKAGDAGLAAVREADAASVVVWRLGVEHITGKRN
jgi:nitroimidazol reductase NimA-like FMN-containing flavoprotein (pyridoxamine 5'-phosphate oxidase superfamily)